jgi:O-antigen ligase
MLVGAVPTPFTITFEQRGILLKLPDAALLLAYGVVLITLCAKPMVWRGLVSQSTTWLTSGANGVWFLLPLWMLFTTVYAAEPVLALYHGLHTLLAVGCLVLILSTAHPSALVPLLVPTIVMAVLQSLIGMGQFLAGGSIGFAFLGETLFTSDRARGLTYNPNTYGSFLVIAVYLVGLLIDRYPRWSLPALVVILLGLFTSLSRTSVAAVLIGGLTLLPNLIAMQQHRRFRPLLLLGCLVTVVGSIIIAFRTGNSSLIERLTFSFSGTLLVIQDHPLLGVGAGNLVMSIADAVTAGRIAEAATTAGVWLQPAHNAYLTLYAELGLPGVLLFGLFLARLVREFFAHLSIPQHILRAGFIAVFCIMLLEYHFWLDAHWRLVLLWFLGLWYALPKLHPPNSAPSPL